MDLSQFSTEDLLAMKAGDLSKVSTPGLQMMRQMQAHDSAAADTAAWAAHINPTDGMSGMDKFNAGVGKAFSDLGLGVRQRLGLADRSDVAESRKLDAPLMKTGSGLAGNLAGNLTLFAPASLAPGAAAVPAAATIGAITGYLQPSASAKEDVVNTGLGAVAAGAGQKIANLAQGSAAFQQSQNAAKATQGAQKAGAQEAAMNAGYVIPPEDIGQGGGIVTKILSGSGGKIKTAQVASERNQGVTNALARDAIGMAKDEPLNLQTLQSIRQAAGNAYDAVKKTGTVAADATYGKALDDIAQKYTTTAQAFPGAVKSDIPDLVAALKQPGFSAEAAVDMTKILRANADKAFAANDKTTGAAYRAASDAIEGMLERHLQAQGSPDALKAFQDARALIAKTYTVQKAINPQTGDVAAGVLAKQLDKGKPLSDQLLTIAQAAQAAPRATQALKEAPKTFSPLDMAVASIKGDPLGLLTVGARPVARSMLLSRPMQKSAIEAAQTPQDVNLLLRALSNESATVPLSVTGGNALARYLMTNQ